jgi:hypothetical protein
MTTLGSTLSDQPYPDILLVATRYWLSAKAPEKWVPSHDIVVPPGLWDKGVEET